MIAVDIPSGVEANTGKVGGEAIKAHCTVTLALPKVGLVVGPGATRVGRLVIADISIPRALIDAQAIPNRLIDLEWCAERLPKPEPGGAQGGLRTRLGPGRFPPV